MADIRVIGLSHVIPLTDVPGLADPGVSLLLVDVERSRYLEVGLSDEEAAQFMELIDGETGELGGVREDSRKPLPEDVRGVDLQEKGASPQNMERRRHSPGAGAPLGDESEVGDQI